MNDSRQKRSIRQKTTSKASLFLMEIMIGMVFFAIAATGCVRVFARAHLLSQEAEDLQMAQSLAAEAVEELRADTELWESLAEAGETAAQEQTVLSQDYDESWELCENAEEAKYHLTANVSVERTATKQTATGQTAAKQATTEEVPLTSLKEDETESNHTYDDEETRRNVRLGHILVQVTDSDGAQWYALETDQAIPYTLADAETER